MVNWRLIRSLLLSLLGWIIKIWTPKTLDEKKQSRRDEIAKLRTEKDDTQNQMAVAMHPPVNLTEYTRLDRLLRDIDRKIARLVERDK